jgi:hypothetical protein
LQTFDDLLTHEYLPVIERIFVRSCYELQSLPGERFGCVPFLKDLTTWDCPQLDWKREMLLPVSLQKLSLLNCGDLSTLVPNFLENTSLTSLKMVSCKHITSLPGHLWSSNLVSLQELWIENCRDLSSIGGANTITNIEKVHISGCRKFK